jgi:superfamily I DNA and/or RNA helicase
MQLPPTLNSFNDEKTEDGLAKTLFVRLVSNGYEPIMLRTQYRCHPKFSKIANTLFYGNRLLDGKSEYSS